MEPISFAFAIPFGVTLFFFALYGLTLAIQSKRPIQVKEHTKTKKTAVLVVSNVVLFAVIAMWMWALAHNWREALLAYFASVVTYWAIKDSLDDLKKKVKANRR